MAGVFSITEIFGAAALALIILIVIFKFCAREKKPATERKNDRFDETEKKRNNSESNKKSSKSKKQQNISKKKEPAYAHEWLLTTLKAHSGEVLDMDFSANAKYLASCADDRTVMLWTVKEFSEKNHRFVRANIEYDHATLIKWSPDSKAFIVAVANENSIQVHKLAKKKDGLLGNVDVIMRFQVHHQADIINIGIACNGLFIMSCSSDTTMVIWSLKGEPLTTIDTHHISNYYAIVSPCGRFVASSGFTPDVRIWEVCFTKNGEFQEVKRAFELKGHTSGVYNFAFSNNSSRMATVSKDGTWKLWDTNIEYSKGQEPYLMQSCGLKKTSCKSSIALSSDGRTVAVCSQADIFIYSAVSGDLQTSILDIGTDSIKVLTFSPDDQYLLATAGRHIRVFRNLPGYKNAILELEEAKKNASNISLKERLQYQIDEAKSNLKALEEAIAK